MKGPRENEVAIQSKGNFEGNVVRKVMGSRLDELNDFFFQFTQSFQPH
jgi:hypothetical protein